MKSLRYLVLFPMIILGFTILAQPGSYYPPPANVIYHNDTLTICPPDSLPGEPVILVAYNIYVDNVFFDNVLVTNPSDTVDYLFTFPALPPGDHSFCANAVYNQWISDQACDSAIVIYGYELPFLEGWSSGNFSELQWMPSSGNWVISNEEGNPAPAAEFRGDPSQTNYTINLESFAIDASNLLEGKIWLDFDLKLDCINPTGDEILRVEVWNWTHKVWTTVAEFYNDEGGFTWDGEHINIKAQAMDKVFKVRFQASGVNSADIQGWFVDNIHIYRRCDGPSDLVLEENIDYNELSWIPPESNCCDNTIHWDDGVYSGNSIGTGGAVEFDVAARWTPEQLSPYHDGFIYTIYFLPAEPEATYNIRVWKGAGPDTMIVDQVVTAPVIGEWNYVDLATPVPLDTSKELWVGYYVNTPTGYPAGVDDGPAINGYGNMINFGGWQTLLQINPNLNYNWNIACLIKREPGPDEPEKFYNIYRKTINEEFQFYNTTVDIEYIDTNIILSDIYCYNVTMVRILYGDTCESAPSNTVCEVVNLVNNEPQQHNAVRIYPNPTQTWLNIESEEKIRSIRLYNILGEEELKLEIGNLDYKVDVSRFQSGIYYINVSTVSREFKTKVVILR